AGAGAPPPGPLSISASLAAPLPGEVETPPARADQPIIPPTKLTAPPAPIPGFQSSSLSADPDAAPPPSAPAPRTAARAPKPPRKTESRALKDMLGFGDPSSAPPDATAEAALEPDRPGASFGQPPPPAPSPASDELEAPEEDESLPLVDESAIRPL